MQSFFEIHDFTQINGQGPDIGSQYLSCNFLCGWKAKSISENNFRVKLQGFKVATSLYEFIPFYEAEDYHQDYYERHQRCLIVIDIGKYFK